MHVDFYILAFSAVTVVATIWLGFWAARKSKTAQDFFVAGRSVGVGWNASAISGEYLSAASFMGLGGMKGITLVQAFQYWAKMFAISVPIFILMAVYGHYGAQLGKNGVVPSRPLPPKAPADAAWLNPFGPLTTKAAKVAAASLTNRLQFSSQLPLRADWSPADKLDRKSTRLNSSHT